MELKKIEYKLTVCKNTDYILVKEENFARALSVLAAEGYRVV